MRLSEQKLALRLLVPACANLLLTLIVAVHPAMAADPAPEDVVKAAVVFKLTKFVEWPASIFESSATKLQICALGDTPVSEALEVVEGRITQQREVEFVRVSTASDASGCHLLFFGKRAASRLRSLLDAQAESGVLTVSDSAGFANNGGIVELTRRGTRLGFRVNVNNARRAGLTVSAPLLELAEIVE
ncbi:MAG: YfiR family protein [Congregibacter sp.]